MMGNYHVRCGVGEKMEITSKSYLSLQLLVKFFFPASERGYEIVQFNLINPLNTDVYNPLGYAVEAAREGDFPKMAEFLTNLSEIFFPKDGGEDKVWPESAAAAFERSCLGMIDYYLEEEKELRRQAEKNNLNPRLLDAEINNMWGKVTLFNCFQFFLKLVSKKEADPQKLWVSEEDITFQLDNDGNIVVDEYGVPQIKVDEDAEVEPVALLDLFFNATEQFPRNGVRDQIDSANQTLKTMMQSEKMLSSVYGIATSGMRFFADPKVVALTSGAASQNFDIQSLSFPRRAAVRFSVDWMNKHKYAGKLARFSAYKDETFKEELDPKLFGHDHIIGKDGWARYSFDGKFEGMKGFVKMDIIDPRNDFLIRTFYFRCDLDYRKSLDGRSYVKDPVKNERIVQNGRMTELVWKEEEGKCVEASTVIRKQIMDFADYEEGQEKPKPYTVKSLAFSDTKLKYSLKPKMINENFCEINYCFI